MGTVSVPVMIAGMAWACGPSGYGTPESPSVPNTNTAAPVAPTSPSAPTSAAPTSSPAPTSVAPQNGSATTQGIQSSGRTTPQAPSANRTAPRTSVPTPAARADLNARINGDTAGVVTQRGQTVFRSSTAPRAAKKPARAKGTPRPAKTTPAVSERAATGDLWGGLASSDANLASAAALSNDGGGMSTGLVATLALLGLGLAGLTGGALATAGRRRKAGAAKRQ